MANQVFGESQESLDINKKVQLTKLALLSGMMPSARHGANGAFVHFSNGAQNVFVSGKPINNEALIMGLINIIKANNLSSSPITLYQNGQVDEIGACNLVEKEVMEAYKNASFSPYADHKESYDRAVDYRLARTNVGDLKKNTVQAMTYIVGKNNRAFGKVAADASLPKVIPAFVSKELDSTLKAINEGLSTRRVDDLIERETSFGLKK